MWDVWWVTFPSTWCDVHHATRLVTSPTLSSRPRENDEDFTLPLIFCIYDSAAALIRRLWHFEAARKNLPALECMVTPGRNIFYQLPGLRKSRTLSPAWLSRRPTIHGPKRHLRFLVRQTPCCTPAAVQHFTFIDSLGEWTVLNFEHLEGWERENLQELPTIIYFIDIQILL